MSIIINTVRQLKGIIMGIQFLVDSACDILPEEAAALGVTCIPMQISFGNESFSDGITLSHGDFYKKLETSDTLPVTSQINPALYEAYFAKLTANGDEVVVITLSSGLSGTYQSALIAAEGFPSKVFVVDSLNATVGQRILLQRGLALKEDGLSAEQIANALDEEKRNIRLFAVIDTLEYLKKGGRISAAVAFAGELLGIKPAIAVIDGKVEMVGKARGKQVSSLLKQLISDAGQIDRNRPVAAVYSATDASLQNFFENCPEYKAPVYSLGCTIGTHIGPGAYGFAFFIK